MWRLFLLSITVFCADGTNLRSELVGPEWQDVFSSGGMYVRHGRVKRFVELNEEQPNIPYQPCELPGGATGHCRYLNFCVQNEFKQDFKKFMEHFCIIKHTAIGVCCPDDSEGNSGNQGMQGLPVPEDGGSTALAGDLPAIAPKDESDVFLKIERAENRGCGVSTRPHTHSGDGQPANPQEWPWVAVIILWSYKRHCGGSLITERHVLTAAHCTRKWSAQNLVVRLGEYDLQRTNDSRSYNFKVVEIRQHEGYESLTHHHDIAILKLHRPALFNTYIWPICLPPPGIDIVNKTAVVVGWGRKWYYGPYSDVLMEVTVPMWNHETCVDSFNDAIFDEQICAGGYEGNKDSCQGDSGGPLMYQMKSGRWVVLGVVSWGIGCGDGYHPGVYVQVDQYLNWIVKNSRF